MALRVWLPLNGNLENKGLSNIIPSGTPTFLDNGKMGKCISIAQRVSFTKLPKLDKFTVLFWLKVDSCSVDWADSLGFTSKQADGSSASMFRFEATTSSRACSFHNNSPYAITQGSRILITGTQWGQWHHCGVSYDGENVYTYIDGVLTYTDIGLGGYLIDYFHIGETSHMVGGMNDLRIYDECLSQKEIKEISKGLVAHYKLDTPGSINNLKRNTVPWSYNNYSSSGSTCTVVDTGTFYNGAKVYRMTYTPNDTSLSNVQTTLYGHGIITSGTTFLANTKYCFWILWKPISHMDTVVGGTASNVGGWIEIPTKKWNNEWNIVGQYRNGSVTTDKTDSIFTSFKCPSATSGTPIIIDFCCPHLVEGYNYILEEFDYKGTDSLYVKDCSGNGYDGTRNGTLVFNSDTFRYSGSTLFDGDTSCITIPFNTICPENIFTINVWFKKDSIGTKNYETLIGGPSGFEMDTRNNNASVLSLYMANARGGNKATDISFGEWHMVTMTRDGIKEKYYVDGEFKSEIDAVSMPTGTYYIGAWQTATKQNYYGLMSDFRIYATALSADDILTMYKNSGIIDNKNNVYAYEFKEDNYGNI